MPVSDMLIVLALGTPCYFSWDWKHCRDFRNYYNSMCISSSQSTVFTMHKNEQVGRICALLHLWTNHDVLTTKCSSLPLSLNLVSIVPVICSSQPPSYSWLICHCLQPSCCLSCSLYFLFISAFIVVAKGEIAAHHYLFMFASEPLPFSICMHKCLKWSSTEEEKKIWECRNSSSCIHNLIWAIS